MKLAWIKLAKQLGLPSPLPCRFFFIHKQSGKYEKHRLGKSGKENEKVDDMARNGLYKAPEQVANGKQYQAFNAQPMLNMLH